MLRRFAVAGLAVAMAAIPVAAGSAWALEIQGHRGARGLLPENTLPAFQRAIETGVEVLELDVGIAADGTPMVLHDRLLKPDITRAPGGIWVEKDAEPKVMDLTAAELQRFDVGRIRPGSRTAERFPAQEPVDGTPIPTLDEVLALARAVPGLRVNIETKISPEKPEETVSPELFVEAILASLDRNEMADRAILQSFDWRTLQIAQAKRPGLPTAYLTAQARWLDNVRRGQPGTSPWSAGFDVDDHGGSIPRMVKAAGGAIWSPNYRELSPAEIREAKEIGIEVIVWTVNDPADIRAMIEAGVDGIITDYPDRACRIAQDMGRVACIRE